MAKLSKFTRNIINLAQGTRQCYELHEAIMQESPKSSKSSINAFLHRAKAAGRANEWAIAAAGLVGHMNDAVDRCQDDLLIGCIVYSLGLDFWDLHICEVPQNWATDNHWEFELWLQDEDPEHFADTRGYYSESNFDRTLHDDIMRAINHTNIGDWAHNQEVALRWYQAVILRQEDLMTATTLARLSVR